MKTVRNLFIYFTWTVLVLSCKKDFTFSEITADKITLQVGEKATLTASAVGNDLKYEWSGPCGTKTANASEIIYDAYGTCCLGTHEISCTVKSGGHKETRKITITVQ